MNKELKEIFGEHRYHSISTWLKKEFGEKTIKLAIDGGFTCPNRDGSKGHGGCIFCSDNGPASLLQMLKTRSDFFRTNGHVPAILHTSRTIPILTLLSKNFAINTTKSLLIQKSKGL